jgi:hypothetical protein
MIVGTGVTAWSEPRSGSAVVRRLSAGETVGIIRKVSGQDWIVADQTWDIASQPWHNTWYQIEGGGYVYAAWIFIPMEDEVSPTSVSNPTVNVDINSQTLTVEYQGRTIYDAAVTTGKPGFDTPTGTFNVFARVEDELMISSPEQPTAEEYRVEHVLFTQYFQWGGYALHMNYWRPTWVFGNAPTSHGCVGLQLHTAQWLWMAGRNGLTVNIS